ncbi:hypothetical protein JCM8097_003913 [Rhodosporidiobolus ruineniae]
MALKEEHSTAQRKPEYFLTQYVCQYNAEQRAVTCQPFVRSFVAKGRNLVEITPHVNQGGRLPEGVEATTEPLVVPVGGASPPPKS